MAPTEEVITTPAQDCAQTAFNTGFLLKFPGEDAWSNQDAGGLPLQPDGYSSWSSARRGVNLYAEFLTRPDVSFGFPIGSTVTSAGASSIAAIGDRESGEVNWPGGSSAVRGPGTVLQASVISKTSLVQQPDTTTPCRRAIAPTGTVTMDDNTDANDCLGSDGSRSGDALPPIEALITPEPTTLALLAVPLMLIMALTIRRGRRARVGAGPGSGEDR